jgi:hypothetical protein
VSWSAGYFGCLFFSSKKELITVLLDSFLRNITMVLIRISFSPSSMLIITSWVFFLGNGEFIVALDSQDRENEGDLIIAADAMTESKMAFMVRYTR